MPATLVSASASRKAALMSEKPCEKCVRLFIEQHRKSFDKGWFKGAEAIKLRIYRSIVNRRDETSNAIRAAAKKAHEDACGSPAGEERPAEPSCHDCGLPYGSERWADVVLPNDAWAKISPTGDENGILCFNCMVGRAARAGIEVLAKITSGPFAEDCKHATCESCGAEDTYAIGPNPYTGDDTVRHICVDCYRASAPTSSAKTPGRWEDGDGRWGGRDTDRWDWPWKPRVCGCCGGVHLDDAIRLIEEGWTVEATGKGYKVYLHPPAPPGLAVVFPVPPVKVYNYHMTPQDVDRFRAAVDAH